MCKIFIRHSAGVGVVAVARRGQNFALCGLQTAFPGALGGWAGLFTTRLAQTVLSYLFFLVTKIKKQGKNSLKANSGKRYSIVTNNKKVAVMPYSVTFL